VIEAKLCVGWLLQAGVLKGVGKGGKGSYGKMGERVVWLSGAASTSTAVLGVRGALLWLKELTPVT
jgi:hypothetical protein